MHINYGKELFLPEGDDYSKNGFCREEEEILSMGNAALQQLRLQAMQERQAACANVRKESAAPPQRPQRGHKKEKLSYKEMLEEALASR